MSAEVLREAARAMRKRAEAARASLSDNVPEWHSVQALMGEGKTEGDAEHITSWHPTVALAVADWLDATAVRIDMGRAPRDGGRRNHGWRGSREALAVARTYLGSDS